MEISMGGNIPKEATFYGSDGASVVVRTALTDTKLCQRPQCIETKGVFTLVLPKQKKIHLVRSRINTAIRRRLSDQDRVGLRTSQDQN